MSEDGKETGDYWHIQGRSVENGLQLGFDKRFPIKKTAPACALHNPFAG
jgi:hypothetical protein